MILTLPYDFDASDVWRTILKGAGALNLVMVAGIVYSLVSGDRLKAAGFAVVELIVFGFTLLFVRYQTGSVGTITSDAVVLQPNKLFGLTLPGPVGTYARDRFSAVRVEYTIGPADTRVQAGPYEVIWLVGRPGTPSIVVGRTHERAITNRDLGPNLAAILELPLEKLNV